MGRQASSRTMTPGAGARRNADAAIAGGASRRSQPADVAGGPGRPGPGLLARGDQPEPAQLIEERAAVDRLDQEVVALALDGLDDVVAIRVSGGHEDPRPLLRRQPRAF